LKLSRRSRLILSSRSWHRIVLGWAPTYWKRYIPPKLWYSPTGFQGNTTQADRNTDLLNGLSVCPYPSNLC
jgi:hypothetical protein